MDWLWNVLWIVLALAAVVAARIHVPRRYRVDEGHVGLVYRHGRFLRTMPAGGAWAWPFGLSIERVDLRKRIEIVQGQEILTRDNLSLKVSLTVRYAVIDALRASHEVADYEASLYTAAQQAIRSVVAGLSGEEVLDRRDVLGPDLRSLVAAEVESIGLAVEAVAIRDVMLPADLRRAFAATIRERLEGLAMLERARGETAALRKLANAADLVKDRPGLLQLRVLETVDAVGRVGGNSLVLGIPPGLLETVPLPERNGGETARKRKSKGKAR